jgi:5'-phosphate synthase pdxT subunit
MNIGVLSLQGGVLEHIKHIKALGEEAIEVKHLKDINNIDGIILPGGESTAIGKILRERNMLAALKEKIVQGLPVWGTCAGMILLAKEIEDNESTHLGVMDIKVRRNAYGRQIDSFCINEIIDEISKESVPLIFIRAPFIVSTGQGVKVIHKHKDNVIAARQNSMLVTSFHPELTKNLEFHRYFISMCKGKKSLATINQKNNQENLL